MTIQLTPHFSSAELACHCGCGFGSRPEDYAPGFLDLLETVRIVYGRPIHPTSGARCDAHNRAVGGVSLSAHTRGAAVDTGATNGFDRYGLIAADILAFLVLRGRMELADAINAAQELAAHAGGIGIAKTFVHLDNDVHLPRPSAWGYPPNTHNS